MDAYLKEMQQMSEEVGRMSGRFACAEGWRRHSYLGFSAEDTDPLAEALGESAVVDDDYDRWLDRTDSARRAAPKRRRNR
jgi:hypothetical protein